VSDTVDTLILDLLEWMGTNPRPYAEVLEAWRTSCPHLPVWEDASDRGFITRRHALVSVSAAGAEHLRKHRQGRAGAGYRSAEITSRVSTANAPPSRSP
jgi:hypothetical protein